MLYFNTSIDKITRAPPENKKKGFEISNTAKDITMCLAIRVSDITPWILERLAFTLAYYDPAPQFLIVDFGSEPIYAKKIKELCHLYPHVQYLYVDDQGTFSSAKARNIGGRAVASSYLLFSDVDYVYERNIFQRLTQLADDLEMSTAIRRMLFMPIYHVAKEATEEFERLSSFEDKQKFIQAMSFMGQHTEFKSMHEFVAPYSNAFLMHKDFFDLSGGYCDEFRGHGSEDFEYLIRLGLLATNAPVPEKLNKDFYGPLKESFFGHKEYVSFRRYLELITAPSESLGLKTFHMWHEKPAAKGYWTAENDWKRDRFNDIIGRYYPDQHKIINLDFHPRDRKALCLFNDDQSWGYFLPLRLYNYQLTAFNDADDHAIRNIMLAVEKHEFDRIFIFNPYMKSHAQFKQILDLARDVGIEITVIERGGLPNSIYYASDVSYADPDYRHLDKILSSYQLESEDASQSMIATLRSGNDCLEKQECYQQTFARHDRLINNNRLKVFIPLQLNDDMAVTQFTENHTSYEAYYNELSQVTRDYPHVIFLIKRHPLSKENLQIDRDNVLYLEQHDNVHALIDICDATICYNSGVGLLSVIHKKPTFNIGNAYYSSPTTFSNQVNSIQTALDLLLKKQFHISTEQDVLYFIDWLINHKYSWFTGNSIIREFKFRKSHAYGNIVVERIHLDGRSRNCGNKLHRYGFSRKSYLGWKTTLNTSHKHLQKYRSKSIPTAPSLKKTIITSILSTIISDKKIKKLEKDPNSFFDDSNHRLSKYIKRYYLH